MNTTRTELESPARSIHEVLPRVMRDVGAIGKSQQNTERNYRFRSIDNALNAVNPVLIDHDVSVSIRCFDHRIQVQRDRDRYGNPRTLCRATLLLEVTFWAPDGSSVASTAAGEGLDLNGDKATAKAMSAAMKYALYFGLMIPVRRGEVEDGELDRAGENSPQK